LNSTNSKIPVLYGLDAVIGAGHILKAALFPHVCINQLWLVYYDRVLTLKFRTSLWPLLLTSPSSNELVTLLAETRARLASIMHWHLLPMLASSLDGADFTKL
jgi:hypothetical protein